MDGNTISFYSNGTNNYAIKTYREKFINLFPISPCVREIVYLKYFKHENLIELTDIIFSCDRYKIKILMPQLKYDLKISKRINENTTRLIFHKCLKGLMYLHDLGFVHRDIKPENILCDETFNVVKICDFGSIKPLPSESEIDSLNDDGMTPLYTPPELLFTDHKYLYDTSIDLWALACTIWEILFNQVLFNSCNYIGLAMTIVNVLGMPDYSLYKNINKFYTNNIKKTDTFLNPEFIGYKSKLSPKLRDILFSILIYDPKNRPNCDQLLKNDYFNNLENQDVQSIQSPNLNKGECKNNINICCCYWIACLTHDLNIESKVLLSTIKLYDSLNDVMFIENKYKQKYIISCLSICVDLYMYSSLSISTYIEYAANSINDDDINKTRMEILKVVQPEWIVNIPNTNLLNNDESKSNCIILYITGEYRLYSNEEIISICTGGTGNLEILNKLVGIIKFYKLDNIKMPYKIQNKITM